MNLYEHTIIARQDTSPSEIKQLTEKYSKIVEKNEGEIVKTENWGLLNLSYLIKKNNFEINSVASALAKTKEYKIATLMPIFDDDDMFWESPFLGVEKASSEIKDLLTRITTILVLNCSY